MSDRMSERSLDNSQQLNDMLLLDISGSTKHETQTTYTYKEELLSPIGFIHDLADKAAPEMDAVEFRIRSSLDETKQALYALNARNFLLCVLISANGNKQASVQRLQKETAGLEDKLGEIQENIVKQRETQQQNLRVLDDGMQGTAIMDEQDRKRGLLENAYEQHRRLIILEQENGKLKEDRLKYLDLLNQHATNHVESESITRAMEIEEMERSINMIKTQGTNTERFKIRPLMRELTSLEQRNQDLKWSMHDKQDLYQQNKKYEEQIKSIEQEKLINLSKINKSYKANIVRNDRDIEGKTKALEQLRFMNDGIRKQTQMLMEQYTTHLAQMRMEHDSSVKSLQIDIEELREKHEEVTIFDKQWKHTVNENVDHIYNMVQQTEATAIESECDKLKQIDTDLTLIGHFANSLTNIMRAGKNQLNHGIHSEEVDENDEETKTDELLGMINDETQNIFFGNENACADHETTATAHTELPKAENVNKMMRMPPKPSKFAIQESLELPQSQPATKSSALSNRSLADRIARFERNVHAQYT